MQQFFGELGKGFLFEARHIDYFTHSQNNDSTNIIIISPNYHRIIHKNRSSSARLLPKGRKIRGLTVGSSNSNLIMARC